MSVTRAAGVSASSYCELKLAALPATRFAPGTSFSFSWEAANNVRLESLASEATPRPEVVISDVCSDAGWRYAVSSRSSVTYLGGSGWNQCPSGYTYLGKEGVVGPASGKAGGRRDLLIQGF